MSDRTTTARPVCTWVMVPDPAGASRLEARWVTPGGACRKAA